MYTRTQLNRMTKAQLVDILVPTRDRTQHFLIVNAEDGVVPIFFSANSLKEAAQEAIHMGYTDDIWDGSFKDEEIILSIYQLTGVTIEHVQEPNWRIVEA